MSPDEAISIAKNEAWALAYLTAVLENPYLVRYYNSWLEGSMLHLVVDLGHTDRVLPRKHR